MNVTLTIQIKFENFEMVCIDCPVTRRQIEFAMGETIFSEASDNAVKSGQVQFDPGDLDLTDSSICPETKLVCRTLS